MLADPRRRLPHSARDRDPRAFGRRCGTTIATTQSDRTRQLPQQEVALCSRPRCPIRIPEGVRLVEVLVDLGQPPPLYQRYTPAG